MEQIFEILIFGEFFLKFWICNYICRYEMLHGENVHRRSQWMGILL